MTIYYVDWVSGNNANDGLSEGAPKKSVPALSRRDVVRLKRGINYAPGGQLSFGTADYITVTSYGDPAAPMPSITIAANAFGGCTFQGLLPLVHDVRLENFVDSANPGVSRVQGLYFQRAGGGAAGTARGVGGIVLGCQFYNLQGNAIYLDGATNSGQMAASAPAFFVCFDSTFDLIGEDCIYGGATYYEVARNVASRMSNVVDTGDFVGFINADPTLAWVHDNYVDHRSADAKQCIVIDTGTPAGYALLERNILLGYGSDTGVIATLHNPISVDCRADVRRNYIETTHQGIYTDAANSTVSHNVIKVLSGSTASPTMYAAADNQAFYNNTVWGYPHGTRGKTRLTAATPASGLTITSGATNAQVFNNVFGNLDMAMVLNNPSNVRRGNNAFYNNRIDYASSSYVALARQSTDIDVTAEDFYNVPTMDMRPRSFDLLVRGIERKYPDFFEKYDATALSYIGAMMERSR